MFTMAENLTSNCDVQKQNNFEFIKNILQLLLQHGLDSTIAYKHILQSVMEMVQNLRSSKDMLCIYELALILIQYGADPNIVLNSKATSGSAIIISEIANFGASMQTNSSGAAVTSSNEPGPIVELDSDNSSPDAVSVAGIGARDGYRSTGGSFRAHSRYILFYYIILITKKEFILLDSMRIYTKIIYLFYFTMNHEPLFNCLKCLHNFYMAQIPNKNTEYLIALIANLYRKPRSLKQICRQAILGALNNKLAQNVTKLNLPGQLREYMLNFEP